MLATALLFFALLSPAIQEDDTPELRGRATVFRLDHIETLDGDAITGGVIVVRSGMIEKLGVAVVVPEDAIEIDLRGTGATAMPPLVVSSSTMLQTDSRGRGNKSQWRAADSLWLEEDSWQELLEAGVVMMGVDPPGNGIPGRTSVLDVNHGWPRATALVDDLHLKLTIDASSSAKDVLRNGFKAADEAIEKEEKARADWEKARSEWEERQKEKAKDEKAENKGGKDDAKSPNGEKKNGGEEDKEPPKEFTAPTIPDNTKALIELVNKERVAVIHINSPAEWLHWEDVLGEREISWQAVLSFSSSTNLHEVIQRIVDSGVKIHASTRISYLPQTRIRINLAAELVAAGLEQISLLPASDNLRGVREWRVHLADLVREGLARDTALKAVSIYPAAALGQEEKIQSLKAGAPANFVIFGGDPLDPVAQANFVVYEGKIIYDRAQEEDK